MEIGFIILMALAVPIVLVWPLLIWAGAIRGIYRAIKAKPKVKAIVK